MESTKDSMIQSINVCMHACIKEYVYRSECLMLPCPGGVIVMVCPVNSSSKYRVSVSEVTWGLNGGTSCWGRTTVSGITVVSLLTMHIVSR